MRLGDGSHEPGLEAECIRPGRWLIEGYEVERHGRHLWRVFYCGEHRFTAPTLNACRGFIRQDRSE